jgi:hypothetical protein
VGSREAADNSLRFTDNITKKASKDYKVVVSGFAKGAIPVTNEGVPLNQPYKEPANGTTMVAEPETSVETEIRNLLETRARTAKEILIQLGNDWLAKKLAALMKTLDFVETTKVKGVNYYRLKRANQEKQTDLFGNHVS